MALESANIYKKSESRLCAKDIGEIEAALKIAKALAAFGQRNFLVFLVEVALQELLCEKEALAQRKAHHSRGRTV